MQLKFGMFVCLVAVFILGCGNTSAGDTVKGLPSDVTVKPGTYAGYRVVSPCQDMGGVNIGVVGLGVQRIADVNEIAKVGDDLMAAVRDIRSVHSGGGYGLACEAGVGTLVVLDDWRDVDRVIARAGQLLRERDLSMQVGVRVEPIPVAN